MVSYGCLLYVNDENLRKLITVNFFIFGNPIESHPCVEDNWDLGNLHVCLDEGFFFFLGGNFKISFR